MALSSEESSQTWSSFFIPVARYIQDLIRRQVNDITTNEVPALSTGAIIGIAVAGAIVLFAILLLLVLYCARIRHRRNGTSKKIDLGDDEDDVRLDVLPAEPANMDLGRGTTYTPYLLN